MCTSTTKIQTNSGVLKTCSVVFLIAFGGSASSYVTSVFDVTFILTKTVVIHFETIQCEEPFSMLRKLDDLLRNILHRIYGYFLAVCMICFTLIQL